MEERAGAARTYYRAIDAGEYGRLRGVLAPGFVHDRPDRTLSGPDRFVRFMREERPMTDTTHAVDALYHEEEARRAHHDEDTRPAHHGTDDAGGEVAVRGRLLRDGEALFGFVDVFTFEGTEISRLRTYTR